jgi:drug/metabolite transporter (DMT)-like permease
MAHLLMLIAALIWGTTFIAQTTGMETIGPFGFTGARYLIGALAVLPFAVYECRKCSLLKEMQKDNLLLLQALGLGVMMFGGISLQQTALQYTLVANAAFLTTLYVPAVPLLIWLINRSVITRQIWLALGLCIGGSWLLSGSTSLLNQWGDFLVTIGALFWAGHIVLIGLVTKKIKAPFQLAFLQSILCVVFATPPTLLIETPLWTDFLPVLPELVYAGLFSVGIAYTLQLVAQGYASTTIAAFILSLESVFAAISGWLFLSQTLTISAITGCVMIFVAILIADVLPPQWLKFWQKRSVT